MADFFEFGDDLVLKIWSLSELVFQVIHASILSTQLVLDLVELVLQCAYLLLEHIVFSNDLLIFGLKVSYEIFLTCNFFVQNAMMVCEFFDLFFLVANHIF